MGDSEELDLESERGEEAAQALRLASFGEQLPHIARLFSDAGALGIVLIDASPLASIESFYGGPALQRVLDGLGALTMELVGGRIGIDDLIVSGESGRTEIAVLIFRGTGESDFYRRELPELAREVAEGIRTRGHKVGYPYLKNLPPMQVGTGAALRNPTIRTESQIRKALEEARGHADLNGRIDQRRRRKRLFELILEGRISSVYEPVVEVQTRTVFGYEALARGPEGTDLHAPLKLFAMASEHDLIFQLDSLCRRSGLDGARGLPAGTKLFLNVRPTTIHDPNFRGEAVTRVLEACNLQPSDVVFEISEQESIQNFSIFREVRDYYGKLGFLIALDDTGAGYASLEAVMELAPEFIKVDRAFVAGIDEDPGRQELLRALRSVADRIGSKIIGEGLDTLEELETLGKLGIPYGQGWLFGKPHPLRSED